MLNTKTVLSIFIIGVLFNHKTFAEQKNDHLNIPYPSDAKIFADLNDELPVVLNYFTQLNEQEIISYYTEKFGEPISNNMKRGRLTLNFSMNDKNLRVIISQQGNRYQVDILLN